MKERENFKKINGKLDALGPLERRMMEILWEHGELSGRALFLVLEQSLAYTTVVTTLDRLHQKGLLQRVLAGRAHVYLPTLSRTEFEQAMTRGLLEQLLERSARRVEPLLSCIIEAVTEHDQELLEELERLVQEKKQQLQSRLPGKERS